VTARCFLCFERDTKGANVMYSTVCCCQCKSSDSG